MKILLRLFRRRGRGLIPGALLDAGLPFDELKRALGSLAVEGLGHRRRSSRQDRPDRGEVPCVHEHSHACRRRSSSARASSLEAHLCRDRAISTECERQGQGDQDVPPPRRGRSGHPRHHAGEGALHEVGALDSIIDIVGAVFAIEWFKADKIVVSPINVGGGMVKSAHGVFPVPAPATVALLTNTPVYSSGIQAELLTPTGALILTDSPRNSARAADDDRPRRLRRGDRELTETPNVVRVLVGEASEDPGQALRPSGPHVPSCCRPRMRNRRHEPANLRRAHGPALRRRALSKCSTRRCK